MKILPVNLKLTYSSLFLLVVSVNIIGQSTKTDAGKTGGYSYFKGGAIRVVPSSHQDIAWMDSIGKCIEIRDVKMITPVLSRLKANSDFKFSVEDGLSLREYLERHPDSYDEIMKYTREGRLEWGATYKQPHESMYVGESLIRQTYLGRKWLKKTLPGCDFKVYRNEDVPGRSLQMAQILSKSGIPYMQFSRRQPGIYRWYSPDGNEIPYQTIDEHQIKGNRDEVITFLFVAGNVPSMGYKTFYLLNGKSGSVQEEFRNSNHYYENRYYKAEFAAGGIKTLYDKELGVSLLNTEKFLGGELFTMQSVGNGAGEFTDVQQPGDHSYTFSIYSHKGDWKNGYRYATQSNQPLKAVMGKPTSGATMPGTMSFISVENKNLILSTVKKCEDDDNVIVRCYDIEGIDSDASISLFSPYRMAELTNMIEEEGKTIPGSGNSLGVRVGHNSIETFKLFLK